MDYGMVDLPRFPKDAKIQVTASVNGLSPDKSEITAVR
jgi:hypothetical protein